MESLTNLALPFVILLLGLYFLRFRQTGQRRDHDFRLRQLELDAQRGQAETEAQEKDRHDRDMQDYQRSRREEEEAIRNSAGAGTGGFIVIDLSEDQRPLFHDLLSSFEEFARLKGYLSLLLR